MKKFTTTRIDFEARIAVTIIFRWGTCGRVNQHVFISVVQRYTLQVLGKLVLNVGLVCKSVKHVLLC